MSTNYTENFALCQWEPTDQVLRTDFNADNAKIDAALAGKADASALASLTQTVSGKASQSALSALTQTVSGKASQSALSALSQTVSTLSATVSGHTSQISKLGNCELYTATYAGNGQTGSSGARSITFPDKPMLVLVVSASGGSSQLFLFQGITQAANTQSAYSVTVSWSGNKVTWYSSNASAAMNYSGYTYQVLALLDCSQ